MYDYEIETIMSENNHVISREIYKMICSTSPQIRNIKYNPYDDTTEIETELGRYWKFKVKE